MKICLYSGNCGEITELPKTNERLNELFKLGIIPRQGEYIEVDPTDIDEWDDNATMDFYDKHGSHAVDMLKIHYVEYDFIENVINLAIEEQNIN